MIPHNAEIKNVCEDVRDWIINGEHFAMGRARKSGVYAFYACSGPQEVCLYVGKAFDLKNRIQQHVFHSDWVNTFFDEVWADKLECPMFARVWFSDNRAALESEMIDELHPRYNKRKE